jgi:hypothetical protein
VLRGAVEHEHLYFSHAPANGGELRSIAMHSMEASRKSNRKLAMRVTP